MNLQRAIKSIIYLVVFTWTVFLFVQGQALHASFLKPLSAVTTVVIWIAIAFDLYLWKWPIFRWLVKRPAVDGSWRVELQSNWINPATNEGIPPIEAFMIITQTLSTLTMRLMTPESTSKLVGAEIVCAPDKIYCISGVYHNEPAYSVRYRSEIHYGGLNLQIAEDDKTTITGHYWTDRKTAGTMTLTERSSKKYQSYSAAKAGFDGITKG
jgi:hypothetical protein